jgi:glycosyltransferase involved in cell wall biosynthesis
VAPGVAPAAPRAAPISGPPTILSIGSVYPRKRPQDLIHAVMRLPAPRPRCVLVGSLEWNHVNDTSMAAAIGAHPETFTLTGVVERPSDYFSMASVYCTASGDETFGMAVVEAALAGVPLALSDLPCYEGIWKHGVNALLAPVGAVDCIAWNLRALLEDAQLAARLAQAARQTAAYFSMDRFLRGMSDALVQAIQDPVRLPGQPR